MFDFTLGYISSSRGTDGRSRRNRRNLRSERFVPSPAAKFGRITLPQTNYFTVTAPGIGNWERANFSCDRSRDKFARIISKMRPKCPENRILKTDADRDLLAWVGTYCCAYTLPSIWIRRRCILRVPINPKLF